MSYVRTADTGLRTPSRARLRCVSGGVKDRVGSELRFAGSYSLFQGRTDGFEIRPIRPDDAALIVAAISYTSDETYYRRFHTLKRSFSRKELRYLTEVDGKTHVALVAVERGEHRRLAAVARFVIDPTNAHEAELAICVHDPFRRHRLGAEMLRRLRDQASLRGVTQLRAIVQADNVPMHDLLYHVFPDTRVVGRERTEVDYLSFVRPAGEVAAAA